MEWKHVSLFPLKESMKGIHFQTDQEVKAAVSNWLRTQSTEFYAKGIDNLISRWNKCVAKEGDYMGDASPPLCGIQVALPYFTGLQL